MQRFTDILVLVPAGDDAPALVERAVALASSNDARLTLFDAVPSVPSRRRRGGGRGPDLARVIGRARERQLLALASEVADRAEVSVAVRSGEPFVAVIREVLTGGHDLVIAAPDRPAGRVRGLVGASTVLHLLRKCPCPVWVDDPVTRQRADVVAAVGPSLDPDGVDRTLVELGSSLARRQGGAFHVVHGWRLEGESLLRSHLSGFEAAEVDAMAAGVLEDTEDRLRALLAAALPVGDEPKVHLHKGVPADVVTRVVSDVEPGVVVMGTLARTGVEGVIIGNTAERILGGISASVLAVKPDGFRSPVRP
ncbi:MAG: universal stress protein [Acidimicrobiia bacterium]|nr:universal stress protein [Acidimicrobiia bacterium]